MGAPRCDNIARRSRAETVIGKEPRAGVRLDMTRSVLLSLFIAFTTLLAAAPQAVAPEELSRALHDPHDSLWSQPAPSMYRVRIETTKGIILLGVTRALAPRGADRFYHLVQVGFYDYSRFFRVISGRFAQFGIAGDPVIAKIWQNQRFPDDPVKDSNVRGTFAFAMTGPDARTTQIYINTGDQSRLDAMGFAPFGKVVEGMSVIDKLYAGYSETSGGARVRDIKGSYSRKATHISTANSPFLIDWSALKSSKTRSKRLLYNRACLAHTTRLGMKPNA